MTKELLYIHTYICDILLSIVESNHPKTSKLKNSRRMYLVEILAKLSDLYVICFLHLHVICLNIKFIDYYIMKKVRIINCQGVLRRKFYFLFPFSETDKTSKKEKERIEKDRRVDDSLFSLSRERSKVNRDNSFPRRHLNANRY